MAKIKPIRALRYTEKAGDISQCVCPPYDIIGADEREALINRNRFNLVRLELPAGENKYAEAGALLDEWMKDGIIARDEKEGIFVYREEFSALGAEHCLTGIICLVKLCEFSEKVILPHEETLTKAKADRFDLMCATNCNFSSVYSLYNDESGSIKSEADAAMAEAPLCRFTDEEGVTHSLWKIEDGKSLSAIETTLANKQLFIADGHHRYETALNFKKHLKSEGMLEGTDADYMMMTLVDMNDPGLVVFPTHRMIVDKEVSVSEVMKKCGRDFVMSVLPLSVLDGMLADNADNHAFAFYAGGNDFLLMTAKKSILDIPIDGKSEAYSDLDVSILHSYILERALGIDKENMANQVNLRYTRSESEAISAVRSGKATACFIINATKVSQIKAVSLAGDKMPQKSTYFYPKLKTGLVMNMLKK